MHMIYDKHTKDLNPSHGQSLNTMTSDKKKEAESFNDKENNQNAWSCWKWYDRTFRRIR
jgi:hypothetical protein